MVKDDSLFILTWLNSLFILYMVILMFIQIYDKLWNENYLLVILKY